MPSTLPAVARRERSARKPVNQSPMANAQQTQRTRDQRLADVRVDL
jgi:hypothetical protein